MKNTSFLGAVSGMIVLVLMAIAISAMSSGCGRTDERAAAEQEWARQRNAGVSADAAKELGQAISRPAAQRELFDWAMIAQYGSLFQVHEAEKAILSWKGEESARGWFFVRMAAHSWAMKDEAVRRIAALQSKGAIDAVDVEVLVQGAKDDNDRELLAAVTGKKPAKANPAVIAILTIIVVVGCFGWGVARMSGRKPAYGTRRRRNVRRSDPPSCAGQ